MLFLFSCRYKTKKKEYENYIATLETEITDYKQEIENLHKELKKHIDLLNQQPKDQFHDLTNADDNSITYKKQMEMLSTILVDESKKVKQLEIKLKNMESHCEELEDILRVSIIYIFLYNM